MAEMRFSGEEPNETDITIDELRSREDRKHRRRTVFYVLLVFGVVIVFLAVCFFRFFRVAEIRIEGNEKYSEEQIIEKVPIEKGVNLFSFDTDEIAASLRKALPFLGKAEVTRKWPSTVTVTVEERDVNMVMAVGTDAYLLSGDLQVLGKIGKNDIVPGTTELIAGPVAWCLVGETVVFRDERLGKDLTELYATISECGMEEEIISIDISSRFDIYLNYENRFRVYVADIENIDLKMRFLSEIIKRLDPYDTGSIDLSDEREAAVRLDNKSDLD